ncbi:MAG TPA: RNA-directed DNA polymerase [Candidatus Angelobacter sp.]|nr:RNA-directed DNA polymerase [Candidatus Angelobacter sp.]
MQQATEAAVQAAKKDIRRFTALYRFTSAKSFRNWREYEQYRKHLILKKIFRYIVITDITNFFDSVLHSEVSNAFRNYPVPSRLIGLLFYLLERLAIRADYSDSPRIGLPVDQFECSRTIANLVLFPHDHRMVQLVGKNAYVRWMDDQAIGANSRAAGLQIVAALGGSLAKLYLTANAKKTRILSLREAKIHFHLRSNARLDRLENLIRSRSKPRRALVRELRKTWRLALRAKNEGEWEKIQKRVYRLAGLTKARFLRKEALRDILKTPTLTERIADYMRCSGSVREYLKFVRATIRHRQQIHEDVELLLFESLLRVETKGAKARQIANLALKIVKEITDSKRSPTFAAPACLLILRFGNRSNKSSLSRCFSESKSARHPQLIRASAIAYSTFGRKEFTKVRRAAATLLNNPLALMVRMVRRLQKLNQVPDRFKARISLRSDSVRGGLYIDMRTYAAARLLRLNRRKAIRTWLKQWVNGAKKKRVSAFDRRLLARLIV